MLSDEMRAEIAKRRKEWHETALGSTESSLARDRYTDYLLIVMPDLLRAHADAVRLREALTEAVECIRFFHGSPGWDEYQKSPEMRRFAAALQGVGDGR